MPYFLLLTLELLVLYFLSRILIRNFASAVYKFSKNRKSMMYLLSLLFLPGTILHELSHWLVATILFVPTGKITLWPSFEAEGIKLGSVEIAKTDPLRRALVGVAPFIVGTLVLLGSLHLANTNNYFNQPLVALGVFYLVFQIGNTMFSSKKDLEGTATLVAFIIFLYAALYLFGVRVQIPITGQIATQIIELMKLANTLLLVPLGIDLALVVLFKLL